MRFPLKFTTGLLNTGVYFRIGPNKSVSQSRKYLAKSHPDSVIK